MEAEGGQKLTTDDRRLRPKRKSSGLDINRSTVDQQEKTEMLERWSFERVFPLLLRAFLTTNCCKRRSTFIGVSTTLNAVGEFKSKANGRAAREEAAALVPRKERARQSSVTLTSDGSYKRARSRTLQGVAGAPVELNPQQPFAADDIDTDLTLSPAQYLHWFSTGKTVPKGMKLSGLCGRIVKGQGPQSFQWMAGYKPQPLEEGALARACFVTGPVGLQRLLELSAETMKKQQSEKDDSGRSKDTSLLLKMLVEIGYEPLMLYESLDKDFGFELCVFFADTRAVEVRHPHLNLTSHKPHFSSPQAQTHPNLTLSSPHHRKTRRHAARQYSLTGMGSVL